MQSEASIYECPTCGCNDTCQGGCYRFFFGFMDEKDCPHYITKKQAEVKRKEHEQAQAEGFKFAIMQLEHTLRKKITK